MSPLASTFFHSNRAFSPRRYHSPTDLQSPLYENYCPAVLGAKLKQNTVHVASVFALDQRPAIRERMPHVATRAAQNQFLGPPGQSPLWGGGERVALLDTLSFKSVDFGRNSHKSRHRRSLRLENFSSGRRKTGRIFQADLAQSPTRHYVTKINPQ